MNRGRFCAATAVAGLLFVSSLACAQARAQDYPSRFVTMVSPYAAGGGADLLARVVAQKLTDRLGKSFVVENRLGAGGVIAAAAVARAVPDGYTLFMGTSTQLAIQVTLHKTLPYDPATDFAPVALIASVPFVLVVNPALPVRSLADLIRLAQERPGALSYGSSGVGGPPHLYMELLQTMTGIRMTHVPYKGTAQAIVDVVAGHIPIMFSDIAPAVSLLHDGRLRALGISSATRFQALPDIPPLAEVGVPGFDAVAWTMLVAPAKTPNEIVDKLAAEVKSIVASSEVQKLFIDTGNLPLSSPPPAQLRGYLKSEIVRWGRVVEQAGIAGSE
ncbi:MAG TPA: tripartite tricarboxylate transporter substrate binding protein [Xanthobacteraceae bacterium]|nr:tripartite tricarboxylate transporter substrate binding protein [Xanthobacteraceae bacterium]